MESSLISPLFVQLEISRSCNHDCYYCYNSFNHEATENSFSEGELEKIVGELYENDVFSVVLTGGEPFMNRNVFNSALDMFLETSMETYVNTNLSLPISEEEIDKLRRTNLVLASFPSYVKGSFEEITGASTYQDVLNNLEKLSSAGVNLSVNQVVTSQNENDVYKTAKFLYEEFRINSFSATPVVPTEKENLEYTLDGEEIINIGRTLMDLESEGIKTDMLGCIPPCLFPEDMLGHRMTTHGCSAGRDMAAIGPSGRVRRCTKLERDYGNILEEGLRRIWDKITDVEKKENGICNTCLPEAECYGGCEVRAKLEGNDYLVRGLKNPRKLPYKELEEGKEYIIPSTIQWRKEREGFLIGDGGSFVLGNESLLQLVKKLQGVEITTREISATLGSEGKELITHLYNRGVVKNVV